MATFDKHVRRTSTVQCNRKLLEPVQVLDIDPGSPSFLQNEVCLWNIRRQEVSVFKQFFT
jgi:hypothetical protein